MIFNFFKKDKRNKLRKTIDEQDAEYTAKGGKKIIDQDDQKAEARLHQAYLEGEEFELDMLREMNKNLKRKKKLEK